MAELNRIICVNTGDKFGQWYVDNLKYMIDKFYFNFKNTSQIWNIEYYLLIKNFS